MLLINIRQLFLLPSEFGLLSTVLTLCLKLLNRFREIVYPLRPQPLFNSTQLLGGGVRWLFACFLKREA